MMIMIFAEHKQKYLIRMVKIYPQIKKDTFK